MTNSLLSIFPSHTDLLAIGAEDLGSILLEFIPGISQNGMFTIQSFIDQLYRPTGQSYLGGTHRQVLPAFAEALLWLSNQGLVMPAPDQNADWYMLTRRAHTLRNKTDIAAYRKGRILPVELLPPILAEKVWPQFMRGDYEVAVFQAFKEVEVSVRKAANSKGANYPDDLVGVKLMRQAFNPENGPLSDMSLVASERVASMELFSGAMGHARNPVTHRDVALDPQETARLIVFASHLLKIVELRIK